MKTFNVILILVILICLIGTSDAKLPEVGDKVTIETNGPLCILGYYGNITDIDDTMISLNCTHSWKEKPLGSWEDNVFEPYNVSIGKNSIIKLTWTWPP